MAKREGYLSWDDYFMSVALLSGKRSKDPSTQVGAYIVNRNNIIERIGYLKDVLMMNFHGKKKGKH